MWARPTPLALNRVYRQSQGGCSMRGKIFVASVALAAVAALAPSGPASAQAGPKVVSGPGALPQCFKPWAKDTKYFQWPKKAPPYRVAVANGFVGNLWRIQMIKT